MLSNKSNLVLHVMFYFTYLLQNYFRTKADHLKILKHLKITYNEIHANTIYNNQLIYEHT